MNLQKQLEWTFAGRLQTYPNDRTRLGHQNACFRVDLNYLKARLEIRRKQRLSGSDLALLRFLELAQTRGDENLTHVWNRNDFGPVFAIRHNLKFHVHVAWSGANGTVFAGEVRGDDERNCGRSRAVLDSEAELRPFPGVHAAQIESWGRNKQKVRCLCRSFLQSLNFGGRALVLFLEGLSARDVVHHLKCQDETEERVEHLVGRVDQVEDRIRRSVL